MTHSAEQRGTPPVDARAIHIETYVLDGPTTTRVEREGREGGEDDDVSHGRHAPFDAAARRRSDFDADPHARRRAVNVTSAPRLRLDVYIISDAVFGARITWVGATNGSVFITRARAPFVAAIVKRGDAYDFPPAIFNFTRLRENAVGTGCRLRAAAFAVDDDEWSRAGDGSVVKAYARVA